jgi:hypothetical protein
MESGEIYTVRMIYMASQGGETEYYARKFIDM